MVKRPLIALVLVASLTNSGRCASASEPLDIPTLLPNTGSAAFLGREFGETLQLLEVRVNRSGGINGRQIHFDVKDTQSSPQVALQLASEAIAKQVPVIIDGGPLALCSSVAPLVKNGPLLWCLSPSFRPDAEGYAYSSTASSRDCLFDALSYFKKRGLKKIAILHGTDATGADADAILSGADLSVSAQMSRIKASGAQAIISYVTSSPVATVLHGMVDAALDLPILTSSGNMSITQLDAYKTFVPKELLFAAFPALDSGAIADVAVQQQIDVFRSEMRGAGNAVDMLHPIPWDPRYFWSTRSRPRVPWQPRSSSAMRSTGSRVGLEFSGATISSPSQIAESASGRSSS